MGDNALFLSLMDLTDTIIAPATPITHACGLAVIRISGQFSSDFFYDSFIFSGPIGPLAPRTATLVDIYDSLSKKVLDRSLVTYFPAPKSFTGESVLELSVHGNPRLVERIINLFVEKYKLRVANAGEFTLRAFRNKKLSLSQIEGLDLLLHSTTLPLIELSQYVLSGGLQDEFYNLRTLFDEHMASIDILTDFSEDIGSDHGWKMFYSSLKKIISSVENFKIRSAVPLELLSRPSVVLFGPPNSGKSTLFNKLLGFNRAITSAIPGTTRDYLREEFLINNSSFFLIDTAGIRNTSEPIEHAGIQLAKSNVSEAFFRVLLFSAADFDAKSFSKFVAENSPSAVIITHIDFVKCRSEFESNVSSLFDLPIFFCNLHDGVCDLMDFKNLILTEYMSYFDNKPILFERQRTEIFHLHSAVTEYFSYLGEYKDPDLGIISNKFCQLRSAADRLIGIVDVERVLGYVFSNFCIGK